MVTKGPSASVTSNSLDESLVKKTIESALPFSATYGGISSLCGDASNRRYYRVALTQSSLPSLIVMQLADPEAFKASEEAVSGPISLPNELPFTNVLAHLSQTGIPVPTLYLYDQDVGLLYLEDYGDRTLAKACEEGVDETQADLYRKAIEILATLHTASTVPVNPRCIAFKRGFDVSLLMWEFEHFLEYGVETRTGRAMTKRDREIVTGEFYKIAQVIAEQPQVFTHRDYHSRNLMVRQQELGVIDFQDALLGPASYDLASLLRDAYIELDEGLIVELLYRYRELVSKTNPVMESTVDLRRLFDFTSVQRNLKAAGRFVYIDRVKGNPNFLTDIPRTLGYVRHNFEAYSQFDLLRTHLAPYVPELQ